MAIQKFCWRLGLMEVGLEYFKLYLQLPGYFFLLNQQSEYYVLYELMCWLSGRLTCRLPNVMRSPPARRSLVSSIIVDWFLAPRRWGFYLKSNSTNYLDHGHHGDPPPTRKIPMVEPGIEARTSWLVANSDHEAGRLSVDVCCALA